MLALKLQFKRMINHSLRHWLNHGFCFKKNVYIKFPMLALNQFKSQAYN